MAVFGKIFGTIAGFAAGGPAGAILGAALGHAADKNTLLNKPAGGWVENWTRKIAPDLAGAATYVAVKMAATTGKKDQLFALCLIILSAKLARCDGSVNRTEVNGFKKLFQIPPEHQQQIGTLFDQARNRVEDYPKFAMELAQCFKDEKAKLENALILLFMIARADLSPSDPLHPAEQKFLRHVHRIFGLSEQAWEYAASGGTLRSVSDEPDAYHILGLTPQHSDEEIRMQWRKLVRTYHPDALAAKGASPQEIEATTLKIVKINAAWDSIKRNRGL